MSDDIVTRLREMTQGCEASDCSGCEIESAAADEIERLRAEIVRLRGVVVLCPKCYKAENGEGAWEKVVRGE